MSARAGGYIADRFITGIRPQVRSVPGFLDAAEPTCVQSPV